MGIRTLVAGGLAAVLYMAGCGDGRPYALPDGYVEDGGTEGGDGGVDGDADVALEVTNYTSLGMYINTAVAFSGQVTGEPASVFWDKDDRDGDTDMDVRGSAAGDGEYTGVLEGGYTVPGKYRNTMFAENARGRSTGSAGLVKVLDRYDGGMVDDMGESLDELIFDQPRRISAVPYSVWTDLVQQDSRYGTLEAESRDAIGAYQANLARPFGTKEISRVRVVLGNGHDDGRVIFEFADPSIYANMGHVFESIGIGGGNAQALFGIIDTL